jgi:hypothetical protein
MTPFNAAIEDVISNQAFELERKSINPSSLQLEAINRPLVRLPLQDHSLDDLDAQSAQHFGFGRITRVWGAQLISRRRVAQRPEPSSGRRRSEASRRPNA